MKRFTILGFLLVFTAIGSFAVSAQTFNNWKITMRQTGGFAGINKVVELDSRGILNRIDKNRQTSKKINRWKIAEIERLLEELRLPGTRQKNVKGEKIYDGIYRETVISLDGKNYRLEGSSFDDSKILALSKRQQRTLEKLKEKLEEFTDSSPVK